MACGAPVVTTRGTAMEEVAGGAAVLVDAHDPARDRGRHRGARRARPLIARGLERARAFRGMPWPRRPSTCTGRRRRERRPLVLVDADVLGRRRTGDETYVEHLLRALPAVADDLRFAAITRRPELVPDGIEPIELPARSQELRMAFACRASCAGSGLRSRTSSTRCRFVVPARRCSPCRISPGSATERLRLLGPVTFKVFVPRSVRRARRVLAISRADEARPLELYGIAPEKIVVTPLAAGSRPSCPAGERDSFLLFGRDRAAKATAGRRRCRERRGADARRRRAAEGRELAAELRARGADVRGFVPKDELVRLYQ